MSYVIMTDNEWVERLKYLARGKSTYRAEFPYNLLYWNGERFFGDCSNIEKALFNGRDVYNPTVGSYTFPLPATGDATEWALLQQCSDISTNFGKLAKGEPRLLYMEGHIGAYLGEEWIEDGQGVVNCVECTPKWEDGIQFSYVDANGRRFWCKGAAQYGTWTHHGLASKWVKYTDISTAAVVEEAKKEVKADTTEHYGVDDLAVRIIRNEYGNGYKNRLNNLVALGYSEAEVRDAQDLVNEIVGRANNAKEKAERELTIVTAAYDVIAGKYGDGAARKTALTAAYGEDGRAEIQSKVEEFLFA